MKLPKRAKESINTIDTMVEWLHYYMGDDPRFRKFVRNDIGQLEEYLQEISLDHKTHNIRFASKLKGIWQKEKEELKKEIKELKEKLDE
jgi:hypothetical protein